MSYESQFSAVPWYFYAVERATNVTFTDTPQTWPLQAGPDGTVYVWDDFMDLGGERRLAFCRLIFNP